MKSDDYRGIGVFRTTVCDTCGKEFVEAPLSIYKIQHKNKILHACSYTCYNKLKDICKPTKYRRKTRNGG